MPKTAQQEIVDQEPTRHPIDNAQHVFTEDRRGDKMSLHLLYTKQAITHLRMIDNTLRKLHEFANTNMIGVASALAEQRDLLVNGNAAYAEADKILKSLGLSSGSYIVSCLDDKVIE
jgi:predicted RNA-binding protein with PIN domain